MREYQRLWLLSIRKFIKLSYFCKQLNIPSSNISNFIRFDDRSISNDKLNKLCSLIQSYMRDFA